jgi:hypothetical protein
MDDIDHIEKSIFYGNFAVSYENRPRQYSEISDLHSAFFDPNAKMARLLLQL